MLCCATNVRVCLFGEEVAELTWVRGLSPARCNFCSVWSGVKSGVSVHLHVGVGVGISVGVPVAVAVAVAVVCLCTCGDAAQFSSAQFSPSPACLCRDMQITNYLPAYLPTYLGA